MDETRSEETTSLTSSSADSGRPLFVVGVGASAGGLEALEQFFDNVPSTTGLAFVVIQHLSPDFKSLMLELLSRHTDMNIHRVEDGIRVEANSIYLIPPKMNMVLEHGQLRLTEQKQDSGLNLPIDLFFCSLAKSAGAHGIAVVLSGTGSDGSRGIKDVHEASGLVVVQQPESAGFDGMPKNALATGTVDVVAEPKSMASRILQYVESPSAFPRGIVDDEPNMEAVGETAAIFRIFRSTYGIDFSYYRTSMIYRRLDRRARLAHCDNLAEYLQRLETDPEELDSLYRDLLVDVTHFFRDPEAFERLQHEIIPRIVEDTPSGGEIRVWVAGCASGEEAYTYAMLFDSTARRLKRNVEIKVFATDAHQLSLETASTGVYPMEAVMKVPEEFRQQYFRKTGELYSVSKELRQLVIFAPHDITKDPPFTRIDLLSCRNVLIYFESPVQCKAISLFHFGLKSGGVMVLGPSESLGDLDREFDKIDTHWRIYRKLRDVRLPGAGALSLAPALRGVIPAPTSFVSTATRVEKGWLIPEVYEDLLAKYVPASLLVDEQFELVHSFGDARAYLMQPTGRATLDILKMVDGDMRVAISATLHRAKSRQESVVYKGVRWQTETGEQQLKVIAEPYRKGSEKMFLICIEKMETPLPLREPDEVPFDIKDQSAQRIVDLERELQYVKESLQSTVEELETSNEELQSTNEELVASNEELQSTNEELHSVNQELYTVNAEHQRKIGELTQLTNDMDHLLQSTQIGTIFLDRELRIRKFTPAIAEAFKVLHQDIGRPIDHIAYNLNNADFMDDIQRVLDTGELVESEVFTRDQVPFLSRVSPYRSATDEIDGVVLTFVGISRLKETQSTLRAREHELTTITDHIPGLIGYIDDEFRYRFVNQHYLDTFGCDSDRIVGHTVSEVIGDEAFERSVTYMQRALQGEPATFENHVTTADGATMWGIWNYIPDARGDDGQVNGFYVLVNDITRRKQAEMALQLNVEELGESNQMLQRFNRIATGREERMIELKREVNELLQRSNLDPKYDLSRLESDETAGMSVES